MTVNNQIESNYGLFHGQTDVGAKPQTQAQPKQKEAKALFESAGVIVSMSNVGDLQKTLQEVLVSVKEKRLDISRLEISNALAALAASVDGPEQKAALNILALATKTIENTVKNMTMTREEREELVRKKEKAKTDQEKKEIQNQIDVKDKELAQLQGVLDEERGAVGRAIATLGSDAPAILRGVMRTLVASAFALAAQDRLNERKDTAGPIDVSKRILEVFVGVERDQGLDLGLEGELKEIESVWRELDARLMERDLTA